jgi:N-acetylglutamate synthase-like GNAT family acetyltransferase/2-polyprenyl-3-methyl-5-hydroxy-6-metoxy-1,4-benzoquinol methylase
MVRIVPARTDDLPLILQMLRHAELPEGGVEKHLDAFLVAVDEDGHTVGAIGLEEHVPAGLLRSLVVRPERRGGGAGRRLVNALMNAARSRGVRELYLLTLDAAPYFEQFGFERLERSAAPAAIQATEEFASLCPASAVCMRTSLEPVGRPEEPADERGGGANTSIATPVYDAVAERYAAKVDTKPHNAYYERPATRSLLPEVAGRRVLDAGCGPGVNAEWLLEQGAEVEGVDASERMVELARRRTGGRATIHHADFGESLAFLGDQSFDVVVCALALDHMRDWRRVFGEFHRLLRSAGTLVFSTGHPIADLMITGSWHYFDVERCEYTWTGFGDPFRMPYYRRPLSAMLNPLIEAGFVIDHVLEPLPTEEFLRSDPTNYQRLVREPCFLCVRAVKR